MLITKGPGDRIETNCTRCKDTTGHVIIVLVDGKIAKVECLACGSIHKYYPPKPERAPRRVRTGTERTTQSGTRMTPRKQAESAAHESAWRKELERPSAPEARPYALDMQLRVHDVVEHAHFGLGVVLETIGSDKAKIIFRDETRLLRCVCG